MSTVLVVDDSAMDRRFVGELLKDFVGLQVDYAVHGGEAMEKVKQAMPDLVVTDLVMPEMNGLEVVRAMCNDFPQVPVILMTSQGSEEIAVQSLQEGAASYVPKRRLARDLAETVRKVLAVSDRERGHSRLMGCMRKNDCTFVLENDCAMFGPLISYLQEGITQIGLCGDAERTRVGVALEEALANALYHGNLQVSSDLRGEDDEAYHSMIRERIDRPPYRDRRILVRAELSQKRATFVVQDEGAGFDPSGLPDPTDPANLEKVSGRGILLMRTFMDEVAYNEVGNQVTLTKRCPGNNHSPKREEC